MPDPSDQPDVSMKIDDGVCASGPRSVPSQAPEVITLIESAKGVQADLGELAVMLPGEARAVADLLSGTVGPDDENLGMFRATS